MSIVSTATELFKDAIFFLGNPLADRERDRERLLHGETRCAVKHTDSAANSFEAEWSVGIAHVERGVLRFEPHHGPIGPTVIKVRNISPASTSDPVDFNRAGTMSSANFLVETDSGELFVSFPRAMAKQVIAILHGSQEVAR